MDRRELLRSIALITGATVVGGELMVLGCKSEAAKTGLFAAADAGLLDEIAETILPATDVPGAKAVKVGEFMIRMVEDCYDEKQQNIFTTGLTTLAAVCKEKTGKNFIQATAEERHNFLVGIDQEAKAFKPASESDGPHYFTLMKQLAIFGYFTSEIGCTQALRYVQVPGRYEGCIPYTKGEKAWAL